MNDTKTGGFKSFDEFLSNAGKVLRGEIRNDRIQELQEKALTLGTDSAGGVLVPETFADEIFAKAMEDSIVLPRAMSVPISTDRVTMARFVESSRSSTFLGGISFVWLGEGANQSTNVADPAVGQVTLAPKEGVASCWVSNRLENDATNFAEFFRLAFGRAVAFYTDAYCINGVGGKLEPLGVLNCDALISADRTQSTQVNIQDFGKMAKRFAPGSWKNGVLLINQGVIGELVEMQADADQSVSIFNLADMRFLGLPVIPTEKVPALGSAGDCLLADFSQYIIAKRSLIVAASRHIKDYFEKGLTLWKLEVRFDGQPGVNEAVTPYKGSDTVSPFVALAA